MIYTLILQYFVLSKHRLLFIPCEGKVNWQIHCKALNLPNLLLKFGELGIDGS